MEVKARYIAEESSPGENQYIFAYDIRIINENPEIIQLLHRHWIITDALGRVEEVKGPGVIGRQPRLRPGEAHEYSSFCPLPTPFGSMRGSYRMMRDSGEIFDVEVPLFSLVEKSPSPSPRLGQ